MHTYQQFELMSSSRLQNGPASVYIMTTNVDTVQTNGHAVVMTKSEKMPNGEPLSNGGPIEQKSSSLDMSKKIQEEPKYDPGKHYENLPMQ